MASLRDLLKGTADYIIRQARQALNWYKERILNIGKNSSTRQPDNVFKNVARPTPGKMYIFTYNPLYKQRLPYWDMYPLVIVLDFYSGPNGPGFLALNLHYLRPLERADLLQRLLDLASDTNMDENTRLNISYRILKANAARYARYEGCVKRYLFGHVISSFHEINSNDWARVVMLPLQRWVNNPRKSGVPPY